MAVAYKRGGLTSGTSLADSSRTMLSILLIGVLVIVALIAWRQNRDLGATRADLEVTRSDFERYSAEHPYSEAGVTRKLTSSRAARGGTALEHMAALLPGYPYDFTDVRYLGGTIDQIVFAEDDAGELSIALVEVKSGRGRVDPRQKKVREAVRAGRVIFQVVQVLAEPDGARCSVRETTGVEEIPPAGELLAPRRRSAAIAVSRPDTSRESRRSPIGISRRVLG